MILNIFSWLSIYTLIHTCRHISHMIALLWLAHKCCCFSVIKSCLILCNLIDCSTPDFPTLHCLSEFAQTYVHWGGDAIQPSYPLFLCPFSSCTQSFTTSRSFPVSQFFTWSGQSIGASASASVLPMSIQGWFPLGLTGFISFLSKGLLRVFSNTTVQKPQFAY